MTGPHRRAEGRGRTFVLAVAVVVAGLLVSCSASSDTRAVGGSVPGSTPDRGVGRGGDAVTGAGDASALRLEALSTRAEYVTGGDVVVVLRPPAGVSGDLKTATLTLDGADAKARWTEDRAGRTVALV